MKTVFADALYWVALARPNDPWKQAAKQAKERLGKTLLLTTDEVLAEFLAALSGGGEHVRRQAVRMVRAVLNNPNVEVVPQTRQTFLDGVDLYEGRLDKEYSLTDCISMNTMRARAVTEVLTNDHHFAQEGFGVLIAKEAGAE